MTKDSKQLVVEWTFAGGWVLLLALGALLAWRVSKNPNRTYRAFVPFVGGLTAFLLVGTIVVGGVYYPR